MMASRVATAPGTQAPGGGLAGSAAPWGGGAGGKERKGGCAAMVVVVVLAVLVVCEDRRVAACVTRGPRWPRVNARPRRPRRRRSCIRSFVHSCTMVEVDFWYLYHG